MNSVDNLIIDGTNLCHINFHVCKNMEDDMYLAGTFMGVLYKILSLYNKFSPKNNILIAFDEKTSWRKMYTSNIAECITHLKYKDNRRKNKEEKLTRKEREQLEKFDQEISLFKTFLKEHTRLIVASDSLLEADDIIGGFVQTVPEQNNIIVSSDKDFKQEITINTRLYNPVDDKFRDISDYNNDAELFLFEKCFRGDTGDSVISAYPRLQSKKIRLAYTDDLLLTNIMNHEYEIEQLDSNGDLIKYKYKTKDVFEENKLLMSLKHQPDFIKERIIKVLNNSFDNPGKFITRKFLSYCNKLNIQRLITENAKFKSLFSFHSVGLSLASSGSPFSHLLPEFV